MTASLLLHTRGRELSILEWFVSDALRGSAAEVFARDGRKEAVLAGLRSARRRLRPWRDSSCSAPAEWSWSAAEATGVVVACRLVLAELVLMPAPAFSPFDQRVHAGLVEFCELVISLYCAWLDADAGPVTGAHRVVIRASREAIH